MSRKKMDAVYVLKYLCKICSHDVHESVSVDHLSIEFLFIRLCVKVLLTAKGHPKVN